MGNKQDWLKKRLAKILLATDLHQNSKLALKYASHFARTFESQLRSLYVFEFGPWGQDVERVEQVPSSDRIDAQEDLKRFLAEGSHPDIVSEVVNDGAFVTTAILRVLAQEDIDLLVLGTEGVHTGIDHLLLGSNTEALMLGTHRLILTVGPKVPDIVEKDIQYKKVVYISDLSLASATAASYASAFGNVFGVETEVHQIASKAALRDPETLKRSAERYCDLLRFSDPDLPPNWYESGFHLSKIVSEENLMALAAEPSNLIILGVQAPTFIQRHLRTSLAYRLLAETKSPVLTVPRG